MASDQEDCVPDMQVDHDYCVTPQTAVVAHELMTKNWKERGGEELQHQLETMQLQSGFGLYRLSGSDDDIRFYTRLVYDQDSILSHPLAFLSVFVCDVNNV